jgi:ferrochelatase
VGHATWQLAYQSRSGPPNQPWLEPDVNDVLRELAREASGGSRDVVVVPIGFVSEHLEVLYDLDEEARKTAQECGLTFVRAATAGTHPRFVQMIRELVEERMSDDPQRPSLGSLGPSHDVCPADCCRYEPRRPGAL